MPNASSALIGPTGFHLRLPLSQGFLWRCLNPPLTMGGRNSKADHSPSFLAFYVCPGRWLWEGGGCGSVYVFSLRLCSAWLPTVVQQEELLACVDPWNTPTPAAPSFPFGPTQLCDFDFVTIFISLALVFWPTVTQGSLPLCYLGTLCIFEAVSEACLGIALSLGKAGSIPVLLIPTGSFSSLFC